MRVAEWRNAGSPWSLAQPIANLASLLRRYGYVVGTIGNDAHLQARIPEDHTLYSVTGWPLPNPYPWVHACDIMAPPAAGPGLPTLAQLGAQIVSDRQNGVSEMGWLKYINWTPAGAACVHESWQPGHARTLSSDMGHIHLSARTDHTHVASTYDPVARLRGSTPPPTPAAPPTGDSPGARVLRLTTPYISPDGSHLAALTADGGIALTIVDLKNWKVQ